MTTASLTAGSAPGQAAAGLSASHVDLGYPGHAVIQDLSLEVLQGEFTVIVGPNACGKSTLLRALGRMLAPSAGEVRLDGREIGRYRAKEVARRVALLPQSPVTPDAITVADLVARGRYPHQQLLKQWSSEDADVVENALRQVGMLDLADRMVDELSGGQRQRVWIAMTLAQDTPILLLDEPTTYLDVVHQIDVLDLCSQLHDQGRTMVAVLHDLNMAARYASHIVVMSEGAIVAQGPADQVLNPDLLKSAFGLDALVLKDPENGRPLVVPRDRRSPRQDRR